MDGSSLVWFGLVWLDWIYVLCLCVVWYGMVLYRIIVIIEGGEIFFRLFLLRLRGCGKYMDDLTFVKAGTFDLWKL